MEQYNKYQQEESSSSEELEIEQNQNQRQIKQDTKQPSKPDIRDFLDVGEYLDICTNRKCFSAKLIDLTQDKILIQIEDQSKSEWIEFDFLTIRKQWVYGLKLSERQRVDVKHRHQGWLVATIIEVKPNEVKVHYNSYKSQYDEWLPNDQVYPLGTKTNTRGMGYLLTQSPQLLNRSQTRYHTYLQVWSTYAFQKLYAKLEQTFPEILRERGLCIKKVEGDGNCMFRAISDQIYGTEVFHAQLREFAMQYLLQEKVFFADFVEGGDIERYVQYKSQDGVWGDNVELQAFRELYGIPIEIYVYSCNPLKTGLELNPQNKEPIRLSYHGRSHYNSLKPINDKFRGLITQQCGEIELSAIQRAKEKQNFQQLERDQLIIMKPNLLEDVFNESRIIFEQDMKKKEEQIIDESIKQQDFDEDQLLDMVIKQSQNEAQELIEKQIQEESLENQIINNVIKESQQQMVDEFEMKKAMEDSIYDDPYSNPVIKQIMETNQFFSLEAVLEAYAVCNGDPELIVNYLYDQQQFG